jgi:hypothetical protein
LFGSTGISRLQKGAESPWGRHSKAKGLPWRQAFFGLLVYRKEGFAVYLLFVLSLVHRKWLDAAQLT